MHELRDTNLSYLSKDKKDKKVCITVCIEDFNKHVLFWQITEEVCTPLRGNLFEKRINDENRKYFLETTEIWNVKIQQLNTCSKLTMQQQQQNDQ